MQLIRKNMSRVITTCIMGALSIVFLIPLIWMISAAFKYEKDVMRFPIQWIPEKINVAYNFKMVWMGRVPFSHFYLNSFKVAIITTCITLIISSMSAYALTKIKFKGRNMVFLALLSFMIIPDHTTLIPRFLLIRWFGIYDTHAAIVLMSMFSIYFTFLLRQFMIGISDEYIEAARIDGAGICGYSGLSLFRSASRCSLPWRSLNLSELWNDYQNPLIFLLNKNLYTIPLGMTLFRDDYSNNYAIMMTAAVSAIIPLVIVFIALQKQVINGISLGGVKG